MTRLHIHKDIYFGVVASFLYLNGQTLQTFKEFYNPDPQILMPSNNSQKIFQKQTPIEKQHPLLILCSKENIVLKNKKPVFYATSFAKNLYV